MTLVGSILSVLLLFLVGSGIASCARRIDLQRHDERFATCGRQVKSQESADGHVVMAGTIHEIRDETPVDGPVRIALVDEDGQLRKLVLGSLYTSPPPSDHRKAIYERIARSKTGDCAKVTGKRTADGRLWVEDFEALDERP